MRKRRPVFFGYLYRMHDNRVKKTDPIVNICGERRQNKLVKDFKKDLGKNNIKAGEAGESRNWKRSF